MFNAGEKIEIFDMNAIILASNEDEVLLYFEKGYVKWLKKSLIQLMKAS
ncbi:MAG: hypothetical protein N2484_07955 [Clostridia bacterium]|nr:hypothetical protein [Clostridia bacterium]